MWPAGLSVCSTVRHPPHKRFMHVTFSLADLGIACQCRWLQSQTIQVSISEDAIWLPFLYLRTSSSPSRRRRLSLFWWPPSYRALKQQRQHSIRGFPRRCGFLRWDWSSSPAPRAARILVSVLHYQHTGPRRGRVLENRKADTTMNMGARSRLQRLNKNLK